MACLKTLKRAASNMIKRIIFFGRKSSIHGLKYVFGERVTRFGRSIWFLILLLFAGCMWFQLTKVIQRGDKVNLMPDTRYLHWTTTFPAVTVCETYHPKKVGEKLSSLFPDLIEPLNDDLKRHLADLLYGRGACRPSTCKPCGTLIPCNVSWRDVIDELHESCNEIISECRFNNKNVSCCNHFQAVDSEYGTCFSFNSLQNQYFEEDQFVVNRSTGPGILTFRLMSDAQITVHSTEELSTNALDKKLRFDVKVNTNKYVDYHFSIIEVENDPLLLEEAIDIRKCRYHEEIPYYPLHNYKVYSYGACRSADAIRKRFEHCKCVHPARDLSYKTLFCNYTGLNCLATYEALHTKLGKGNFDDTKDCLPSCVESELSTIYLSKRWSNSTASGSIVNIKMLALPTLRYHQSLLRTKMDLVVTVGGMAGLFFSASILSFVEILYLMIRK